MKILKTKFSYLLVTGLLSTSLSSFYSFNKVYASESSIIWQSRWADSFLAPPSYNMPWFNGIFKPKIEEEKAKGNPIAQRYTGTSLADAKNFVISYPTEVSKLKAAQASQAQASADAEKRAVEAHQAKLLAEKRQKEAEKREIVEREKRLEEEQAKKIALEREIKLKEEREEANKKFDITQKKLKLLVQKAREHGVDPSILDAILPPTEVLSQEIEALKLKSPSLPSLMQWYVATLEEIKKNENAGEQIKKDLQAVAQAVFAGYTILSDKPTEIDSAIDKIINVYQLARQRKETLPPTFESFKSLAKKRIHDATEFEDFMTTNLLTPLSDALANLDGKDSLQLSLDTNARFEVFLRDLTSIGVYQPDLITPMVREIIESNKKILEEIKKRDISIYQEYLPLFTKERQRIGNLAPQRKLEQIPLPVLLFEFAPTVFLLINTHPSLEDFKEDLPKLTLNQLKGVFVYLFNLLENFSEALAHYSKLSHNRTKVTETEVQQLKGFVRARIQQAEKDGGYNPDLYQVSDDKEEKLQTFLQSAEDFISGKTYRITLLRRFIDVYQPLRDYVQTCQANNLQAFKTERLSQRGAKNVELESDAAYTARSRLIDDIIAFQKDFLGLTADTIINENLSQLTQQFSTLKAAIEANGERFKTTFTAFIKRNDPNYKPPTQIIGMGGSSPSSSSSSSKSSSTNNVSTPSSSFSPVPPPPGPPPSFDGVPPPPSPPSPTSSNSSATSSSSTSSKSDREKMLEQLTKNNIPSQLIEFARKLDPAQKEKWQKLSRPQKILWMNSGTEPAS